MDHHVAIVVEDRVILVFAVARVLIDAVYVVEMLVAEVPAPRPLQQIPSDGGDVSDLRGRGVKGRVGQRDVARTDLVARRNARQRDERAEFETLVRLADRIEAGDRLE